MRVTIDEQMICYRDGGLVCTFDQATGELRSISNEQMKITVNGLWIEVGIDEQFFLGRLKYHTLDPLHTWEMPPIVPQTSQQKTWEFLGYNDRLDQLHMFYKATDLQITVIYKVSSDETLEVSTVIHNLRNEKRLINGVGFLLNRRTNGDVIFDFPGNVPHREFCSSELSPFQAIVTGLVNPLIHSECDNGHLNVLFIDEEEKWGTGVYKDEEEILHYVNVAGVESYLEPGNSLYCGTLYIQPIDKQDPYQPVRTLYRSKGWNPPIDGHTEGVLYSCHPHGTMDSGFKDGKTMREYAEEMPALKSMGIDHVWVLPIFEHLNRGVYHPTDQKIIDPRYGTDEDVAYFSSKLHELGMTLMFDYVPHGPELNDPLGRTSGMGIRKS